MSPTQTTLVQVLPLAAKDLDENKVTPGVLGFLVFAAIGIAVWMLMKSMNKHMNRVDFEDKSVSTGPAGSAGPGTSGTLGDGAEPAAKKERAATAAPSAPKPKTTG
ncbi:hypothetical protein [Streptomyces axinellae]|uniref:Secreted protein n=1 Tax=Streptomyces axinellae TaxID=552788 RepID=A0ABN3QKH1_9ACTN